MTLIFICPKCGCTELLQVVTKITTKELIVAEDGGGLSDVKFCFDEQEEGGQIYYECYTNGHIVTNEKGDPIYGLEAMIDWLREQEPNDDAGQETGLAGRAGGP